MSHGNPAVFLDRDGTLIVEKHYLHDPEGVHFVPGAFEALRAIRDAGFTIVVVTNQAGIARGIYSEEEYRAVEARVNEELTTRGVPAHGTWFCPHHPDFSGPCRCRKPGTGMYEDAAEALGLDLASSWYVGDKPSDVIPAQRLGGRGILVRTGYGIDHENEVGDDILVVDGLPEVAVAVTEAMSR